jgi:hypothetical protein
MMRTPARRDGITRRDFVEGALVAGGAVIGGAPMRALAGDSCDGPIGLDPRALRGGNLPATFMISHWLRDRRLDFRENAVTIAPGCDDHAGAFPIVESGESFDAIIIGGGLAGLSAAFHLLRDCPEARLLILEAGPVLGGNAGRDEATPLPGPASTAGAYCVAPGVDWLRDLYRALDVEWRAHLVDDPVSNFYFDDRAAGVAPGSGWSIDTFEKGFSRLPYSPQVLADLERARQAILLLAEEGVTDPADESESEHDPLSLVSLAQYLETNLGCDKIVSDFFTVYTLSAFGGTAAQVNAHSAIGFLASEFQRRAIFTFPGGTSELARRFQGVFARADMESPPRVELNATALRIDPRSERSGASVVYFKDRMFRRAEAQRIVVAAPAQAARRLVAHVADPARQEAWNMIHAAPLVVANLVLRRAAPLLQLGLGYSQSWFGGRHFVNFAVADWAGDKRADPERATTLTFYGGCAAELDALGEARMALLQTPFSDYEDSLRSDLARLMRGADFDFDRDVSALFLYRWGHSMLRPQPGWLFGTTQRADGALDRSAAPRRIACAPLGPIVFAGQHAQGAPSVESALASGRRAALQALEGVE